MLHFDPLHFSYSSRRYPLYARRGMVATSQPLAAEAGLQVLKQGGNAIDAAVAVAAALTVVEPTSNGIGGDAFALVWFRGRLYGLNASGPAPKGISLEKLSALGIKEIPRFGWIPVTIPGAPFAWAALSERFGQLPLTEVMAPAVGYADEGYPVSPVVGKYWQRAYEIYQKHLKEEMFYAWFHTFAPSGRAPRIGEMWRSPDHGKTLRLIAETKAESFYRGELAERIDAFSTGTGGFLRKGDLEEYRPEWVEPIHIPYRGFDVWEIPPNGHGLVALIALGILDGMSIPAKEDPETYHLQIEALKLAFADGSAYIADSRHMRVKVEALLADHYLSLRRREIGRMALLPKAGTPPQGGTVYLATADQEGNMVSYIQSNYMGFGSGLVVPGTGIALHNRGHNFTLDPSHPNGLAPGKKPYHTIIPGFLTAGGQAIGPFGVMGGFMQPQGHLQVIMNSIDFHMNPQAALDAPRWQWVGGKRVELEQGISPHIAESLRRMGHEIEYAADSGTFGRGQILWRMEDGVLVGGSEPRADGHVAVW